MSHREVLDPVGLLRPSAWGAIRIARTIEAIINEEGERVVSVDEDGMVRVTPPKHPLSQWVIAHERDCVVGTYDGSATSDLIVGDLVEQARLMKATA